MRLSYLVEDSTCVEENTGRKNYNDESWQSEHNWEIHVYEYFKILP